MKEIDSNILVNGFRGSFDKLVFKKVRGKIIITKKPVFTKPPTQKQIAQRERFVDAAEYGKLAMQEPSLRAYYEPIARQRQITVYALAMGDYLSKPKIRSLDVSRFKGQIGDVIQIDTADNVGVIDVQVRFSDGDRDLESGAAVEEQPRHWTYTAKMYLAVPNLYIIVTAQDRPGGVAVKEVCLELS